MMRLGNVFILAHHADFSGTACPLPVEADMRALGWNAVHDPELT
jgi:hypothetical protein